MPLLIRQWGLKTSSEDNLIENLLNTKNILDSSLDSIQGIDMIRGYINASNPSSYESRLSEEEKVEAHYKAYSIWISRMERQVE